MKSRLEAISPTDLKAVLESEYGIIFFPKRQLVIPVVTAENLRAKVQSRRENTTLQLLHVLYKFLCMPAIGDSFGANHYQRITCYKDIRNRFGKSANDFLNQYASENQFRLNKLSIVFMGFKDISERLLDPEVQNHFQTVASELYDMLTGAGERKKYGDIESIQEKFLIVHTFEDKIVEALGKLSK